MRGTASRLSYVTLTGKASSARILATSKALGWALFMGCLTVSGIILLFYLTVIADAFVKTCGVNWAPTLEHFRHAWDVGRDSIKATLYLAAWATPITALLGMIIAFLMVRKRISGKQALGFTSMLAYAVPGTVVGIGTTGRIHAFQVGRNWRIPAAQFDFPPDAIRKLHTTVVEINSRFSEPPPDDYER